MDVRPLHALLLPARESAGRLLHALAAALDGTGPAIAPLDPRLPRAKLDAMLEALAPTAIETPDGVTAFQPGGKPLPPPGSAPRLSAGVPPQVAVVIATSGSTGEPKGVQLTADAMLHSAKASLDRIGARPGDRWLCALPVSHISGLGVLVRSLAAGTEPVVLDRLEDAGGDPAALGCAHVSLVPTQLRRLLAAGADLAAFGTILLGGAAAAPGLLAAARAAGARAVTTYGMSETCGGCVYDARPLDGVAVRTGADGRIWLGGPVVFAGYRGRPDLTEAALADGWFVTSDVGEVDADGRLRVRGRADEMINTGGEKVSPSEVAAALEGCPGIAEAVVVGVPDAEWGQRVVAVVVPQDPGRPPALDGIRSWVRDRLPAFAAPRTLLLVPEVPLLASGKPDRDALRALARKVTRGGDGAGHPGTWGRESAGTIAPAERLLIVPAPHSTSRCRDRHRGDAIQVRARRAQRAAPVRPGRGGASCRGPRLAGERDVPLRLLPGKCKRLRRKTGHERARMICRLRRP